MRECEPLCSFCKVLSASSSTLKDKQPGIWRKYVCCRTRRKPWSLKQELLWAEWISLCQLMNWQRGCQSQDWLPTACNSCMLLQADFATRIGFDFWRGKTRALNWIACPRDSNPRFAAQWRFHFFGCTLYHSLRLRWKGRQLAWWLSEIGSWKAAGNENVCWSSLLCHGSGTLGL